MIDASRTGRSDRQAGRLDGHPHHELGLGGKRLRHDGRYDSERNRGDCSLPRQSPNTRHDLIPLLQRSVRGADVRQRYR